MEQTYISSSPYCLSILLRIKNSLWSPPSYNASFPIMSQCYIDYVVIIADGIKCYCQRKLGRSKRSRSAFDLHLFTIGKPPEKIINGGIFRSWWVFNLKIKISLKPGPFTGMKYLDFRPTFVESIWHYTKRKKLHIFFLTYLTLNRLKYSFQYLSQFHVFVIALDITAKSLMNQTQISAIFTLLFSQKCAFYF